VSRTSHDARAVVRALDALTTGLVDALTDLATQVKRAADYQQSDFTLTPDAADDTPTMGVRPAFTSPIAGRIEVREPCPWCADRPMIPRTLMDEHVARLHPEVHTGGPGIPVPDAESPAADEDQTLRWARRESLLVLVTRVQRGRALTEDEARTLREHVETEMREAEQARAKAGDLTETYKLERRRGDALAEERNQAWAAIERVRAECEQLRAASVLADGEPHTERERGVITAVTRVLAALDGTEQPTTEA
jgi:hypothetical protein